MSKCKALQLIAKEITRYRHEENGEKISDGKQNQLLIQSFASGFNKAWERRFKNREK